MEMYKPGKDRSRLLIIVSLMITTSAMLVDSTSAGDSNASPAWVTAAVEEAERVAAINCSGHGNAYIDGVVVDGKIQCDCNTCYTGSDCSKLLPNCPADATVGDPMFLESYWEERKESSAILISPWSRMSYYASGPDYTSIELEKYIKILHNAVGNAVVDDKYIVFGNGVTQLLNSFVRALSRPRVSALAPRTLNVIAQAPYYPLFRKQTERINSKYYQWKGNARSHVNTTRPRDFIEFVTSPNNPDGRFSLSVINGSLAINDNVYYWPHYTPIEGPIDEDIMMFSMTKLTGHEGSRLGWALVRDYKVQQAVAREFMALGSEGSSHDAQQRALILVKDIVKNIETTNEETEPKKDILVHGYTVMMSRWEQLDAVISKTRRFSLQTRPRRYCEYMKISRRLTPAFAWLKCNREEDCKKVLINGGIKSEGGAEFEADSHYARLSLMKTRDDFEQLIEKLTILVAENELHTSM